MRGIAGDPDAFVITSGMAQGLALASRALGSRGVRRIGMEDPGTGPIRTQIAATGLEPIAIGVDRDGIDVDALEPAGVAARRSRRRCGPGG